MIRQQAINGIRWTGIAAIAGNILQLLQLVIVSKYISATDYGLMALTLAITYFAQFFGDMGISNALIYKQHISKIAFSSLFWISLLFCWFVFGALFFSSPFLAGFFKQPVLTGVIRLTALSFIFLPLQMQYLSLLRKELHFDKIAICDIISKIVSLVTAVILAMNGLGVFSLVYSTLAGLAVSTLLFFYWGRKQISIELNFKISEVREFLHFGIYQTGNDIFNYFNFQVDTILLGKLLGIDALGYYSFAKNLAIKPTQVINPVITQVAFPLMVKANNNTATIKSIFLKMVNYLGTLNFLIYPFIAALSDTIIRVFFGDKWLPAAPVLQALALFCMIRSVFNPVGILLSSRGMVKRLFYWNLILILILPVVVFFSTSEGITGVAIALSVLFSLLIFPMQNYLIYPACGVVLKEFWQCIKTPLLNAMGLFLLLYVYDHFLITPPKVKLLCGLIIWTFSCILLTKFFNKEVYKEASQLVYDQFRYAGKIFKS